MCGHVGYLTISPTVNHKDYFEQALYLDAIRGMHATGICRVPMGAWNEPEIFKRSFGALDFLGMKTTTSMLDKWRQTCFFMGHNRHATRGKHTHLNAHPFRHGNITLAHNGSLTNTIKLPGDRLFDVDSEMIAHSISTIGPQETLKLLQGSFALVWYNEEEKKVYFVRNEQRPLTFAICDEGDTVLYASEELMLRWLASKHHFKIDQIYDVTPKLLISFDLSKTYGNEASLSEYVGEEVEFYEYPKYNGGQGVHYPDRTRPLPGIRGRNTHSSQKSKNERSVGSEEKNGEKSSNKHSEDGGKSPGESNGVSNTSSTGSSTSEESTERRSYATSDERLRDAGFERHEIVRFCFSDYNLYDEFNGLGEGFGFTIQEPIVDIACYSLKETDYDGDSVFEGEVLTAKKDMNSAGGIILVIDSPTLVPAHIIQDEENERKKSMTEALGIGEEDEVAFTELFLGPKHTYITGDEFDKLTKEGCCQCGTNIFTEDHKKIVWFEGGSVMCPECLEEWESSKNILRFPNSKDKSVLN